VLWGDVVSCHKAGFRLTDARHTRSAQSALCELRLDLLQRLALGLRQGEVDGADGHHTQRGEQPVRACGTQLRLSHNRKSSHPHPHTPVARMSVVWSCASNEREKL